MDFARPHPPSAAFHPALRNALEALATALAITLVVSLTVDWTLHNFGYSAELAETLHEAQQWFLPMFAYLFGMFWMIDAGHNSRHCPSGCA